MQFDVERELQANIGAGFRGVTSLERDPDGLTGAHSVGRAVLRAGKWKLKEELMRASEEWRFSGLATLTLAFIEPVFPIVGRCPYEATTLGGQPPPSAVPDLAMRQAAWSGQGEFYWQRRSSGCRCDRGSRENSP